MSLPTIASDVGTKKFSEPAARRCPAPFPACSIPSSATAQAVRVVAATFKSENSGWNQWLFTHVLGVSFIQSLQRNSTEVNTPTVTGSGKAV